MFRHYLKMAFRNLGKYKTQNIISIIGLAVGFACFALSLFWLQFEQSYDHFHSKADRIYRIRHIKKEFQADTINPSFEPFTAYPLADLLKSSFPEIEDAGRVRNGLRTRLKSGKTCDYITVDSVFCKMFDIPFDAHFFAKGLEYAPVMITEKAARDIFGETNVVGDTLENIWGRKWIIQRVIKEWPGNTSYKFDLLIAVDNSESEDLHQWGYSIYHTYILVDRHTNTTALENKLGKLTRQIPFPSNPDVYSIREIHSILTPIKDLHHKKPDDDIVRNVKHSHISIFTLSGSFIILCALFNYLSLFLSLIQMRDREFALRKVNGSSTVQIIRLLLSEFLLVLLTSIAAGYAIITFCIPKFKELAMIELNRSDILTGTVSYTVLLFLCILFACIIPIWYFHRKTLNANITGSVSSGIKNGFRKASLLAQLIIGIGFMFCAVIFFKQIHFLRHSDLGFERRNIATVKGNEWSRLNTFQYKDKIKQIPFVADVIKTPYPQFIHQMSSSSLQAAIEKDGGKIDVIYYYIGCEPRFFDFYNIRLIEGNLPDQSPFGAVINETAAKMMEGEPIGKLLGGNMITGIVKDFYYESPTIPVKPTIIRTVDEKKDQFRGFAYKYREGYRKETEAAVKALIHSDYPNEELKFIYSEDEYDKYLQSEKSLSILLGFVTFACILIAIFGVYSLTSLTCKQRRKEIAIRKVNGAEVSDIMSIFFKEYLILLAIAAIVAFPAGYFIMKRWMEGYVKQTSVDAWLYILIFLAVFIIIVLTIVSMVRKAAGENPAEVVKAE